MSCENCGKRIRARREAYHYTGCGLPNVTLLNVEVHRCATCGWHAVDIPRILDLHALLARLLACKVPRLTPAEARFLRKYLGLSGRDFAAKMGVKPETVSRWESGAQAMGPAAERLLRLMALAYAPIDKYPVDIATALQLDKVARGKAASARLSVRPGKDGWKEAA